MKISSFSLNNFGYFSWNSLSFDAMKCAVYEKFSQNEIIRRQLFSTNNSTMVECSPRDRLWGIGIISNNIFLKFFNIV